ncbi:MAG: hypothetical protein ACOY4I_02085 [Bacillota bacterium]
MLDRCFTIPVVLGLCLGVIMAGVQISAGALGAAIDDYRVTSLVAVENNNENSAVHVLGKKISVDNFPPLAVLLGEKAGGIYSAVSEAALKWSKRLIDFSDLL